MYIKSFETCNVLGDCLQLFLLPFTYQHLQAKGIIKANLEGCSCET